MFSGINKAAAQGDDTLLPAFLIFLVFALSLKCRTFITLGQTFSTSSWEYCYVRESLPKHLVSESYYAWTTFLNVRVGISLCSDKAKTLVINPLAFGLPATVPVAWPMARRTQPCWFRFGFCSLPSVLWPCLVSLLCVSSFTLPRKRLSRIR